MAEKNICVYCGRSEEEVGNIGYHSGVLECWPCLNWRKLDGPAARHWAPIFTQFFSNVDYHDLMTFFPETLGLSDDERSTLFSLMRKVQVNCDHALALHERTRSDA